MITKEVEIQVKDFTYKVMLVDEDYKYLRNKDEQFENMGLTDVIKQVIYIRNDLKPNRMFQVILHEVTHAYLDAYGFAGSRFTEEGVCTFIEAYGQDIYSLAQYIIRRFTVNEGKQD